MAVHGYARSTADLDLGVAIDPTPALTRLVAELRAEGWAASHVHPDADDSLGGVVRIRISDEGSVDVVNFLNPYRAGIESLMLDALQKAEPAEPGSALRVVPLAHLIGLKLYAGDARAVTDVRELVRANPELPLEELRRFLDAYGLASAFELAQP